MAKKKTGGPKSASHEHKAERSAGLTVAFYVLIVVAAIGAYANSFSGALIGDDDAAIAHNDSIRSISTALRPPADTTVAGRPVANLTFAVNYAIAGGTSDLSSYHAFNLAIHIAAGLLLFGVIRRTLRSPALRARFGPHADGIALVVTVLWIIHPLNTQAVTFIVQRVESLMGMFYLATLYLAIRAAETGFRQTGWIAAATAACALGMGTKETMVTAPILVALWIWTCWPDEKLTRRPLRLLLPLAATWIVLIGLVLANARTQSAGIGAGGWTPMMYLRTQAEVIVHYLHLAMWPSPLVFQYGWLPAPSWASVAPQALTLALLGAMTIAALLRRRPFGLLGAAFFLVLAPSSSVVSIATEVAAEHRMYLPLAAIIAAVVLGLVWLAGKARWPPAVIRVVALVMFCAVFFVFGTETRRRNTVYASPEAMAANVVTNRPQNAQAQLTYGVLLMSRKQFAAAEPHLREAATLPLPPSTNEVTSRSVAHLYLGLALSAQQKFGEAVTELQQAIALRPDSERAYGPLAEAQLALKRPRDAAATLEHALERRPDDVVLLKRAAWVMATSSDPAARNGVRASELADRAVTKTEGRDPIALDVLAAAYAEAGQFDRALEAERRALALAPPGDTSGPSQMMRAHIELFQAKQPVRTREW